MYAHVYAFMHVCICMCVCDRAQSLTSVFLTVETVVWGVPALIVTVLLGAGSDRLGRRHVLVCYV